MPNNDVEQGRIVRFMDDQENVWPAMVTLVDRDAGEIYLTVFMSAGTNAGVKASIRPLKEKDAVPGAWWWPTIHNPKNKKVSA
jgi:hypothetical protein